MSKRNVSTSVDGMHVQKVRIELKKRSLGIHGTKAQLLERLKKAIARDSSCSSDGLSAAGALGVESPSSSCSNPDENAARLKRARTAVSSISEDLMCSISHELMVDPVCTSDGVTYERKEIETWLQDNDTSPATNLHLDAKSLIPNILAKNTIAKLLASGELGEKVREDWEERKRGIDLIRAQKLFNDGKVEEAAELGHPKAQGEMATRCYHGTNGQAKDDVKCVYWAKKAAAGGDINGQFWLGFAFHCAHGGLEKNHALALKWYTKSAEQEENYYCTTSMRNIGVIYESGGHGVLRNLETSFSWYSRAAEKGLAGGQLRVGMCYREGKGVAKDLVSARDWYQKSADNNFAKAQLMLGVMMMKGEGGVQDAEGASALWKKAAAQGDEVAQSNLEKLKTVDFSCHI